MMPFTTQFLVGAALLTTDGADLQFPAVQMLEGPLPGNYCNASRANSLIDANTRPGELYAAQGTFKVNGETVYVSAVSPFSFPSGVQTAEFPLPREVLPDSTYAAGTMFSVTTRYFDVATNPVYENEIAIVCDTGETVLLRNTNLDRVFANGFE